MTIIPRQSAKLKSTSRSRQFKGAPISGFLNQLIHTYIRADICGFRSGAVAVIETRRANVTQVAPVRQKKHFSQSLCATFELDSCNHADDDYNDDQIEALLILLPLLFVSHESGSRMIP